MVDQRVLEAQQWVNATYGAVPGYVACAQDGITGWSTMYSLTRGLQHELGITALSDSFGPGTLSALDARGPIGPATAGSNLVRIAQHGLYCKGYAAGTVNGTYHATTQAAVSELMGDAGVESDGLLRSKWFKAILTMDAYVVTSGGSSVIRAVQRWLNGRYIGKSTFFVGPCDGHYSRDVQVALMKGLQYESGIPEAQVNGNFGPGTQAGLRAHQIGSGWSGTWVQLFSAACLFNGRVGTVGASFTDVWNGDLARFVDAFQRFSALEISRVADYPTWAQLLVSTGDPDRPASACDTRFTISLDRARALYAAGYRYIGRYLDKAVEGGYEKELQPGELNAIFAGGLRVFPISQYSSRAVTDFSYALGQDHAGRANDRAAGYGFNPGTVIYFAVDFDATDPQIASNVLPYFQGVQAALAQRGGRYVAGVYGSRNVCTRVSAEAGARFSFVSGMSYGFSGNLGFPMPSNWSFTQVKEFSFSASGDTFDLDNDVCRGTGDRGAGPENVGDTSTDLGSVIDDDGSLNDDSDPPDPSLPLSSFEGA
jgi:peptidoglycan hydrolase-like protein with peptidoglycan-binding domain